MTMKLSAHVQVHCRVLGEQISAPCTSVVRWRHSLLTFCKHSDTLDELYLLLQMRSDKQSMKYKINDNVAKVFTRYVDNGKATIRILQPPHDIIIRSHSDQLKLFLRMLSYIMKGNLQDVDCFVSTVNSRDFTKPQTKIIIKKKSEYPTLEGFPSTTEELFLIGLDRNSFDRQILQLQNLRVLDISDNKISFLPRQLGTLPHLQHLVLSQNEFGKSPKFKWAWLESTCIRNNLLILDISDNSLSALPIQIGQLNALIQLKASKNMLTRLPQNIGILNSLEYLDVARNKLLCLPANLKNLKLRYLNISHNAFLNIDDHRKIVIRMQMISLLEWSARCVLKSRLPYDASTIPATLVQLLNAAKFCSTCGTACFSSYVHMFLQPTNQIASEIMSTYTRYPLILEYFYCSLECSYLPNSPIS